ncbi:hypothetical protein COB57_03400 [Candidatus Peregrinibacteria bacterium]|nr:MAG: hypothetical protein COB57_03400 [Candidatus Peregrinibacteria bacterium]
MTDKKYILMKSVSLLIFRIHSDFSFSECLKVLSQVPKGSSVYLVADNRWKYFHSAHSIHEILKQSENLHLFFKIKDDEIAEKHLHAKGCICVDEIPVDAVDLFAELFPAQKFSLAKVGEAAKDPIETIKILHKSGEEKLEQAYHSFQQVSMKNKILLAVSALVSLFLLLFLAAIIMPQAEVMIVAEKKKMSFMTNVHFTKTDNPFSEEIIQKGNNYPIYTIKRTVTKKEMYPVISKIFEGQLSSGEITLSNSYHESITLKKGTRLKTDEGLLFFTTHYVRIPERKKEKQEDGSFQFISGQAVVHVESGEIDTYGEVIGTRGNIVPQKFYIPGLNSFMQKFLWGESFKKFAGGTTRWRVEVQQSDIDTARAEFVEDLEKAAKQEIISHLDFINKQQKRKIALLPMDQAFSLEEGDIRFPYDVLGLSMKKIEVEGDITISAYVYYEEDLSNNIERIFMERLDPEMKLDLIDYDNMVFQPFFEDDTKIQATLDIEARQSYFIDDLSTEGALFQKEVKDKLRGLQKSSAIKWLYNHPKVHRADISLFPSVKKTLPLIRSHISVIEE